MLTIFNLNKLKKVKNDKVTVLSIKVSISNPQKTYDIVYTHSDWPDKEFFLTIDRETMTKNIHVDVYEYSGELHELTSPHLQKSLVKIWVDNLEYPEKLIDYINLST